MTLTELKQAIEGLRIYEREGMELIKADDVLSLLSEVTVEDVMESECKKCDGRGMK